MNVILRSKDGSPQINVHLPHFIPIRTIIQKHLFVGENIPCGNNIEHQPGILHGNVPDAKVWIITVMAETTTPEYFGIKTTTAVCSVAAAALVIDDFHCLGIG